MYEIPKTVKVGKNKYWIHKRPAKKGLYGRIYLGTRAIEIFERTPERAYQTFWHELTHAILHEMNNDLCSNETFVTEFANKLDGAIKSAKF
jgi:Zn-dependent peptidase ImmA (M78 family)